MIDSVDSQYITLCIASHLLEEVHDLPFMLVTELLLSCERILTPVNTTSKIPPPGPNLSTFGRKPLYRAEKPSSFMTVPSAGHAQLYFGT